MRKSFTHVNLVDKWAMLVKKLTLKRLNDNMQGTQPSGLWKYPVINLQFWAYGSWDSLFPISMSPTANLWVLNTIFNDKSAIQLHPGTRWNKNFASRRQNYAQKMQDAQVTKPLNTMPDLSDLVPFHSEQVENFNLLVLGQVQNLYKVNKIVYFIFWLIIVSSHVALKTVWILISWSGSTLSTRELISAWFHTVFESVNCLSTEWYKLICTIGQVKFSSDKYIMAIYLSVDK